MPKRVVGALLLLLLGAAGILGVYYLLPKLRDAQQRAVSDAQKTKGKITLALDSWVGYFILRSPEMKNELRRAGYTLVVEDDNADYLKRMQRLKEGLVDFAVCTVDAYVLNGAGVEYPGAIVMVIDESKGGDAILARTDRAIDLDSLRGKNDLKVAFTPNSPSHHLAKAAAYHFNVPELLPPPGPSRIETQGSEDALKRLLAGSSDVSVVWEPDVSRGLAQPGIKKLIGTEDTEKLIVDVLLVNRKLAKKSPELVKQVLSLYFMALKKYQDDPELLRTQLSQETGLPDQTVQSMLKGVRWVNLTTNCEGWFGIAPPGGHGEEGLRNAIEATVKVLVHAGDFSRDPLPDKDPSRIIYSAFMEDLFTKGVTGFTAPSPGKAPAGGWTAERPPFRPLSEAQWNNLKEVGTLKVDPVIFPPGGTDLDLMAKEVIDRAAQLLGHYPTFRVLVKGHTGTRGDTDENLRLSRERAEAVARYLTVTHNVDPNRVRAAGYGGIQPLLQEPGESFRTWQYRLPRVELVLVKEDI